MPRVPFVLKADQHLKKPAWLNNPLNYHDRGNIDFGSCSPQCFEQGDFFGLDDLFTEKPNVMNGLAADLRVVDHALPRRRLPRRHREARQRRVLPAVGAEDPRGRRARAAIDDFPIFGEVTLNDAVDLSDFVRTRGLPQLLDFPFQQVASAYASGATGARGVGRRLDDDDYFRIANGVDPMFATFLGNHDMGRAAQQILTQAPGSPATSLLQHVELGWDLLYLLRGAPVVQWGDEVGMIGSGGDRAAREDMFPTQVSDWQTETRVGGAADRQGIVVRHHEPAGGAPEAARRAPRRLPRALDGRVRRAARDRTRCSSSRASTPQPDTRSSSAFNNGTTAATVTVPTATPGATWRVVFGTGSREGRPDADDPAGLSGRRGAQRRRCRRRAPGEAEADGEARRADRVPRPDGDRARRARVGVVRDPAQGRRLAEGRGRRLGAVPRASSTRSASGSGSKVDAVAVARGLDGTVSVSPVVTFTPRP